MTILIARYNSLTGHLSECKDDHIKFASDRIQALIADSNGLRHNRMTWFANIEGLLWLSFATVISQDRDQDVGWQDGLWLLFVIPIIGFLVCLSAISAITDADKAIDSLLREWTNLKGSHIGSPYSNIPVIGLSKEELKAQGGGCVPRCSVALFLLIGWILCFVGAIVTVSLTPTG